MIDLVRGAIVIVKDALDPQGQNPKDRPAIVLSKDCSKDAVVVVYITGEFDKPLPPEQVALRWAKDGNSLTGLTKASVAVCTWHESVLKNRILRRIGYCNDYTQSAIIDMLKIILRG